MRGVPRPNLAAIRAQRAVTLSHLGCGLLRLLTGVGTGGALIAVYALLQRVSLIPPLDPHAPSTWLVSFIAYDFVFYVGHRTSHRVALLWAVHSVHHQPSDFDLSIGFRLGALAPISAFPFYAPLALLGIPTQVFVALSAIYPVLIFWTHARKCPRLGVLELWLNTPHHHRLHHSQRAEHLDKNFGGFLIVWDRLLGSFSKDERPADFGVGYAEMPLSPISANLAPFRALARRVRETSGLLPRILVLLATPQDQREPTSPAPPLPPDRYRSRLRHIVAVLGALLLGVLALWSSAGDVVTALVLVPLAVLAADFFSAFAHWALDHHVPPGRGPLASLAREFREHHSAPDAEPRIGFFYTAAKTTPIVAPLLLVGLVAPAGSLTTLVVLFGFVLLFAPELHKLAHRGSSNPFLKALFDAGILLSTEAHSRHHRGDHREAMAVVTGWTNPLFDRLRFFPRLDRLLGARRVRPA